MTLHEDASLNYGLRPGAGHMVQGSQLGCSLNIQNRKIDTLLREQLNYAVGVP